MSERADRIIAEAAQLFAQRGFGATSIDDIGAAVGISGPAIYWHFVGKQALLAAMLIDISERLLDGARSSVEESASGVDAVVRLVALQVAFALREPDLIVIHGRDLHHLDAAQAQKVRLLQRQYIDVWTTVLTSTHPDLARNRLGAAVRAVIGLINSTPNLGRVDRKSLEPMLVAMALAALAAIS
ncbi:MAG: TetR/AcrR family transcriptional regulator [Ilumatobacteraceae bacterium]